MSKLSDAVDLEKAPILAVENPGKKELADLNNIIGKLLTHFKLLAGEKK